MDSRENERDMQLIREKEEHEKNYKKYLEDQIENLETDFLTRVVENMLNSDEFDELMEERFDYLDETYFDIDDYYYEEDPLEQIRYMKYEALFEADEEDFDDSYDYPEGPNENLNGVYFGNPYESYEEEQYYQEVIECEPPYELFDEEDYYEYLAEQLMEEYNVDNDEIHMQNLIKEHLKEEKDYLDSIVEDALQEELYFPKAIDEVIFANLGLDYDEYDIDYDDAPTYWYDKPDESIKEPFESFDEIDYPEGYVERSDAPPEVYDFDMQKDYEKYRRTHPKEVFEGFSAEQIPEPPEVIAFSKKEKDKIKELLKQHYTRNDTLDNIVKEKIKERKLRKKSSNKGESK